MFGPPPGTRVYLACGVTDMRKGFDGLAAQVQTVLAWWLSSVAEAIGAYALAQGVIWTDDTPIAVLAPGRGRTRQARFWVYAFDPRPWGGTGPPAAYYRYSPDRKGEL
jgi:Transposase IS66 family/IS66 Orf2 like protein